ncbi:CDP-glycerol glycerophosphotransferase family protein [Cytobacillus firmus]|uniref:CDP-glycerol glycerophosphotransferase family protein n=1 Tax=Cytobacillus firmus TaxID=1399 RepID=UPI0020421F3B|nr:glycosyltransferase [Cytobacillus firmus]MCM3705703.1 CDP-glycerol glycerophosphotransferase family protein [Cytobacillus firmus]
MANKMIIPMKKIKRIVERITGYKITVSPDSRKRKKKSKLSLLIDTELIEKKDVIFARNRSISSGSERKYRTNTSFRREVDYTTYYENLEIRDNTILYESFHGKNMSCNPFAIFKSLVKDPEFSNFHHIWALNDLNNCPQEFIDLPNVEFVSINSDEYLRYIASCKYLINNTSFPPYFIKKDGQVYVNTWHGTPLKTLGKDMKGTLGQHKNLMRNFLQTDYIIAPNRFTAEKIIDSHDLRGIYQGKVAEIGYPRIDLLFEESQYVKNELGIKGRKKVVLYAPTWRGEVGNVTGEINKIIYDIKLLEEKLGSKYQVMLKVHSLMQKFVKENNLDLNIVPDNIDSNELLSCVDILITDYSSIFFDFLVTKKPIIFYAYDQNKYKKERGFYLDLEEMPGPICLEISEVIKEIYAAQNYKETYKVQLETCIKNYASLENGNSTKRFIDTVFKNSNEYSYQVIDNKKNILIYCGGFLNNGVTTSAINLTNNINYEKFNVMVADKASYDEESAKNFNKLNENVKKYYRVGSMNVLLEEVEKQNYLFNYGAESFYSNGAENYLDNDILKMYNREFKRMFGNSKFDIVIDFSGYVKFWTLLFAANGANKKLIFQHNEMMEEYKKIVDGKYKHKENLNVIFPVYNYFDYIVSVAQHTRNKNKKELEHLVLNSEEKMVCVHNSINYKYVFDLLEKRNTITIGNKEFYLKENSIENNILNIKGELIPDNTLFNFVTMGRMSPEKDQQKLIHAFAKCYERNQNIALYIIGTGELRSELSTLISSLGLEENVHLVGQLDNPFPLIHDCDCFVLPSNHEGQPMVLLECLILDKPIVATDIPGNRSVLENGYGEIVDNSVDGLVIGMEKIMNEKPNYKVFDYKKYNKEAMNMFYKIIN